MLNETNKGKKARNLKTGNVGTVVCEYNKTSNGKPVVEVYGISGSVYKNLHWAAKNVEIIG